MRRAALVLVLLLAAGCASRGAVGPRETVPEPRRSEILEALKQRNDALASLRGIATVRYGSALFGARGETVFAVFRPDRLRIDGLADFGLYHSQLALNKGRLAILWPADQRYFEGEATSEALARYLLVGLPPETVVGILLGSIPLRGDEPGLRVLGKGGRFLVRSERVEAWVEPKADGDGVLTYVPVQYTVADPDGNPVYRVGFEEYVKEGPLWFANRMTARFWENGPSRTKARVEVRFREIEINAKMDPKVFELKIPKDAEPVSEM